MIETKLQKYQEIQAMVQNEIKTLFPKLFKDQTQSQYNINKIPNHEHNGTDSVRVPAVNLQNNIKYGMNINIQYSASPTSEQIQIRTIPNMESIALSGFGANNLSVAATKRAIFNGNAAFGRCFTFNAPGALVTPDVPLIGVPIVQGGNSMFTDAASAANTRVAYTSENVILINDNLGAVVMSLTFDDWTNGILTMTAFMPQPDWQVYISIIMS